MKRTIFNMQFIVIVKHFNHMVADKLFALKLKKRLFTH